MTSLRLMCFVCLRTPSKATEEEKPTQPQKPQHFTSFFPSLAANPQVTILLSALPLPVCVYGKDMQIRLISYSLIANRCEFEWFVICVAPAIQYIVDLSMVYLYQKLSMTSFTIPYIMLFTSSRKHLHMNPPCFLKLILILSSHIHGHFLIKLYFGQIPIGHCSCPLHLT